MGSRMFAAVLPPEGVVAELDGLLDPRRAADPAVRWTRPSGWHLTASFMADVDPGAVEGLGELLAGVAAKVPPFRVRVAGGLAFPDVSRARILALGVPEGAGELGRISAGARRAASRCGVRADGSRFVPHLTLARVKGVNAARWMEILGSFPGWGWDVEEFCLVESHEMGRRYEVVERFPLGRGVVCAEEGT